MMNALKLAKLKFMLPVPMFVILLALTFAGCNGSNCMNGEGPAITKTLEVAGFTGLTVSGSQKVTIAQGPAFVVKVTGQENIINKLKTEVADSIWNITFESGCYNYDELSFEITMPNLKSLTSVGSGNIEVGDFSNQPELHTKISGSSQITLNKFQGLSRLSIDITGSGAVVAKQEISSVDQIDVSISGSGSFMGFPIITQNCVVEIAGSGDCEVHAIKSLAASITGAGSVRYRGTPAITKELSGSGKVTAAE